MILVGLELRPNGAARGQVLGVAEAIASTIVTGALLADVPHTRPVKVSAGRGPCPPNPTRPRPLLLRGANRHRGGAHVPGGGGGFPTATFWASVPFYVPGALPKGGARPRPSRV